MGSKHYEVVVGHLPIEYLDPSSNHETLDDLEETLTSVQKELVLGLNRASDVVRAVIRRNIRRGTTRELLQAHDLIDEDVHLTPLGELFADTLAFRAGQGPNPQSIAQTRLAEAAMRPEVVGVVVGAPGT